MYIYLNLYKYIIIYVVTHFLNFNAILFNELNIVKVIYLCHTLTLLWHIGLNTQLSNSKKTIVYEKIATTVRNKKNVFFFYYIECKVQVLIRMLILFVVQCGFTQNKI